ncbi:MAG TPA: hypothetical protein DCF99_05965 [Flavobacteriaceae bacterium]|nr:hypothetical protein [Flavobacteriaceae bacterium]
MKNLIEEDDLMLAGTQYENRFYNAEGSRTGSKLELEIEENNLIDPLAVMVQFQGADIGYVPRSENIEIAYYLNLPEQFKVECRLKKKKDDEYNYEMIVVNIYVYAIVSNYEVFSYDLFDEQFPNYDEIVSRNIQSKKISESGSKQKSDDFIDNENTVLKGMTSVERKALKEKERKKEQEGCLKFLAIAIILLAIYLIFIR